MNLQQSLHITPPGSFTRPPLTPPPTDEKPTWLGSSIVAKIQSRKDGQFPSIEPWIGYTLDEKGYNDLVELLRSDESLWGFVSHKLRYDYFPSTQRLVLRMLTIVHETIIFSVVEELYLQLRSIARSQNRSAVFAREVEPGGSATIDFADSEYGRHDPDAQFRHSRAQYPGVVIEVSYSQKRHDLARLADDYILGSDGDIRIVVGLDVEYRGSKKATLSVWQPEIITNEGGEKELVAVQTVVDQVFRDENGNPNNAADAGLYLQLQDFATEALVENYGTLNDRVYISSATLCAYLDHAEEKAVVIEEDRGVVRPTKPWVRKRRRQETPSETLDQTREKRFREDEKRAADEAVREDSSYKASSASEGESS